MTGRNAGPVEGVWASGGPAFSQEPQKCIAVSGVVIPATALPVFRLLSCFGLRGRRLGQTILVVTCTCHKPEHISSCEPGHHLNSLRGIACVSEDRGMLKP